MKKVAFITYKDNPSLSDGDQLVVEPMSKFGYEVVPAPWDDPSIDWAKFNFVVFRSCWNYHHKTEEFTKWLSLLENSKVKTWNPIKTVKWNLHKTYLEDLKERFSIKVAPTTYVKRGESASLHDIVSKSGWSEVVIKPSIGASGFNIFKLASSEAEKFQSTFSSMLLAADVMIQPLIPELVQKGETSMIFLNKRFSHAVNRKPKQGDFRSNYEYGGIESSTNPDSKTIDEAQNILSKIDSPLLYARVDGVVRNGKLMLMELELIEPYLFLSFDKKSPERFAEAFNSLNKN